LPAHEVGDDVRSGDGDDEVAVGHDLSAERDDVPEHGQLVAGPFEVARPLQFAGRDVRGAQCPRADRHTAVHRHHEQVEAESDGHHTHPCEMEVGDREPDQQAQRDQSDDDGTVSRHAVGDDLADDAEGEQGPQPDPGPRESRGPRR